MRRFVIALVVGLVVLRLGHRRRGLGARLARARGTASAVTVGVPTSVTATALTSSSVRIDWAAPASGADADAVPRAPDRADERHRLHGERAHGHLHRHRPHRVHRVQLHGRVADRHQLDLGTERDRVGHHARPARPSRSRPAGGTKTAGTAFNVTITATTNGVTTDTAYSGAKTITFSGPGNAPSGAAPTYPASVTFTSGVGTASVTLRRAETVSLAATDGTRSGSVSVTVVAGAAAKLGWSSSTPACATGGTINVGAGGTFTTKVTAYDTFLNPKTGARTVHLSRSPAQGTLSADVPHDRRRRLGDDRLDHLHPAGHLRQRDRDRRVQRTDRASTCDREPVALSRGIPAVPTGRAWWWSCRARCRRPRPKLPKRTRTLFSSWWTATACARRSLRISSRATVGQLRRSRA